MIQKNVEERLTSVIKAQSAALDAVKWEYSMKQLLAVVLLALSANVIADTYVRGHTRSDGTYVQPHYRSDSNNTKFDNYSTKGNTNPYTGQQGYVDPYRSDNNYGYQQPKSYNSNQYER